MDQDTRELDAALDAMEDERQMVEVEPADLEDDGRDPLTTFTKMQLIARLHEAEREYDTLSRETERLRENLAVAREHAAQATGNVGRLRKEADEARGETSRARQAQAQAEDEAAHLRSLLARQMDQVNALIRVLDRVTKEDAS